MPKKKRVSNSKPKNETERTTLSDQLDSNVLAQLKSAKKDLEVEQRKKDEERQAQLAFERKQREKNKSFEELLDEYGFSGKKFS